MNEPELINKLLDRHKKNLERMRKYNKEHKDELNEKARAYFKKIKADPEKYKKYLENKRKRYKELNPKIELPYKEFE